MLLHIRVYLSDAHFFAYATMLHRCCRTGYCLFLNRCENYGPVKMLWRTTALAQRSKALSACNVSACITLVMVCIKHFTLCCWRSSVVAASCARSTTNGKCAKNSNYIFVAWTINNRTSTSCDLYCCLLPQRGVLRACCSGFPIATKCLNAFRAMQWLKSPITFSSKREFRTPNFFLSNSFTLHRTWREEGGSPRKIVVTNLPPILPLTSRPSPLKRIAAGDDVTQRSRWFHFVCWPRSLALRAFLPHWRDRRRQ